MIASLEGLAELVLDAAKAAGADAADAMAISERSVSVDVRNGTLEKAERAEGTEIGLRVFVGQKQACVSASDTRGSVLKVLAERAVAMAREAPDDPSAGLADPADLAGTLDVSTLQLHEPNSEPEPDAMQDAACTVEATALAVAGVTQVQAASADYEYEDVFFAATNGFRGGYATSTHSLSCVAIAGEGADMQRDFDGDTRIFASDLRSAEAIGRRAAERATAMLGARKPPTGAYPVLFDERVASSLVGHVLVAANGSSVSRGASWLLGKMGEQVLPSSVSLVEDPHRPRALGSRPFDAEGLPARKQAFVENGILQSWVLDLSTGRKLGLPSTGNARRGPSAPPMPATGNIELTSGAHSQAELLREMGTGLLVTSMIGSTINPNTGDYSRGASGFWVENGEIAYPVNECTIAGSLPEMLRSIVPANDARPWLSRVVPSLLVEGLTLAGE